MRFSVAFWHTFRGTGGDPFGAPTKNWPWEDGTNSVAMAKRRSKSILCYLNLLHLALRNISTKEIFIFAYLKMQ